MPAAILHIRQKNLAPNRHQITLRLRLADQPDLEAEATVDFGLSAQEQEELRWYMEDYLQHADTTPAVQIEQVETLMQQRGVELYDKVLAANQNTQAIWFAIRNQLADLRIEIQAGIAEAAAIPWELLRDPQSNSALAVRVAAFVRVQSNPHISFVPVPANPSGRIRLLFVMSRPNGINDVIPFRSSANRLLQGLAENRVRFDIVDLRPPTYEQLQRTLKAAKEQGQPFHIVHFDGHGCYTDLSTTVLADWLPLMPLSERTGQHGYLLFEHLAHKSNIRPVSGKELGELLHDNGVPSLVLDACQTAMHQAAGQPEDAATVHDEIRAIGSLAQAVVDCGIPAVLAMRYSVYVVTAAQYVGELYAGLSLGRDFGQAASAARQHLQRNPDRWIGLKPRPLQDWFVPVIYEAQPLTLLKPSPDGEGRLGGNQNNPDPVQRNTELLRYVPDSGFVGRDETLLMLDRGFDNHRVVLLHAYAGQGKSSTAVEFARWYAETGGLGSDPLVLLTSFENYTTLNDALNQLGRLFMPQFEKHGIDWLALNDQTQRRDLLLQVLRQIPLLWIWDNVEPVAGFPQGNASLWTAQEQQELADFLKLLKLDTASKVKLLLTSRRDEQHWLGGIPFRINMPRMSSADAALLVLKLGEERNLQRHQLGDWQPLLRFCNGNPLTLRVVAMQVINSGLRSREQISAFIQALRDGEQAVEGEDAAEGGDRSLAASLAYGFAHAFTAEELTIVALLHCFQGVVDVNALAWMGEGKYALAELQGKDQQQLSDLLNRASDIGLLTPLGGTWYSIHPALPWFLQQQFARHYDGKAGRSQGVAALQAWVAAIGQLGDYYHRQFNEGNREVIALLSIEEANLLHGRRLARRQGWWDSLTSAMQGLRALYQYQGRSAEWARLVAEITADYCTADDQPVAGREQEYSLVMEYRVTLAQYQNRNLTVAATLQHKRVAWDRQLAAEALAVADGVPLSAGQRNAIRTLGVGVFTLGQILYEQKNSACVAAYQEGIGYCQRIADSAAEVVIHYNLGHAYLLITDIRDLNAAEAAYQHSLSLRGRDDALGQSRCIKQIGMVHTERFDIAHQQDAPAEILLHHFQAAESCYLDALKLCPAAAITDLAPLHGGLGALYQRAGQIEAARKHYEQGVHYCEQTGDRYGAGGTRYNLSRMYLQTAGQADSPERRRDLLQRAHAYADAALRDYQAYQGRAADDEARAQQLIDVIERLLSGR